MIKVSKRDLILDSIIQAYLSDNAPIGSSELGSRMGMSIPASTIRVYFKKLSEVKFRRNAKYRKSKPTKVAKR